MPRSSETRPDAEMLAVVVERATVVRRARRRRRRILGAGAAAAAVVMVLAAGVISTGLRDDAAETVTAEEGTASPTTDPPDDPAGIWGRTWRVTRLVVDGDELPATLGGGDEPIVLDLGREGLVGAEVCNQFGSTVVLEGDRLREVGGGSTLAGCSGTISLQEQAIMELLRDAPTVALRGGTLVLQTPITTLELADASADHPPQGVADRGEPSLLWGRRWQVYDVDLRDADDPDVPVRADVPDRIVPVLDATTPGRLVWEGCRRVDGPAQLDGDRLVWTATPAGTTDDWCPDGATDEAATAFDDQLVAILGTGADDPAAAPVVYVPGSDPVSWVYLVTDDAEVTLTATR